MPRSRWRTSLEEGYPSRPAPRLRAYPVARQGAEAHLESGTQMGACFDAAEIHAYRSDGLRDGRPDAGEYALGAEQLDRARHAHEAVCHVGVHCVDAGHVD